MKTLACLAVVLLLAVCGTAATAQTQPYRLTNITSVPIYVCVHTQNCGTAGPFLVPPGSISLPTSVLIPPCVVNGISYSTTSGGQCPLGPIYAVGYNGALPPPNPPNLLRVTSAEAVFR